MSEKELLAKSNAAYARLVVIRRCCNGPCNCNQCREYAKYFYAMQRAQQRLIEMQK